MALKTKEYNSENNITGNLKHFLIFLRDNDLKFKTTDYYGRGYILDDIEMNDDEIIKKYKDEEY